MRMIFLLSFLLFSAVSCGSRDGVVPPRFDESRAFEYLIAQVDLGPRVPGSAAWLKARQYYYRHFQDLGLQVDSQAFSFFDPYSLKEVPLVNVIARVPGTEPGSLPLLFVAHYDSRPRTDYHTDPARRSEPLTGANDGASGVAVLMELANLFSQQPPPADVVLLLVDGEDWGESGDTEHYLLGSKEFAARGIRDQYRFAIIIDMIGDADLAIHREVYSERFNKPLNDMVWEAAAELELPGFRDSVQHSVLDDHLPITAGGLPAIVLIDFDYPYWHTEKDTPDKCSPESLRQVGTLLAYIAYNPSLWPRK